MRRTSDRYWKSEEKNSRKNVVRDRNAKTKESNVSENYMLFAERNIYVNAKEYFLLKY